MMGSGGGSYAGMAGQQPQGGNNGMYMGYTGGGQGQNEINAGQFQMLHDQTGYGMAGSQYLRGNNNMYND